MGEASGASEEPQKTALALDSKWKKVARVDLASGAIASSRRTPIGGLVARANLTRIGVFNYTQPDGSVRRELRHPDEVFDADSLDSLAHATLTVDHPEKVTPDNWKEHTVGHVAGRPKRDGKFVAAELHLQDGKAAAAAEKGKLQELSCGYDCHLDETPGTYQGEDYDAIQRGIRYNHVAAGPAGWGRAGAEVRMHLDGGTGVCVADGGERPSYVRDTMADAANPQPDLAKLTADLSALTARADKQDTELKALKAANEKLEGENVGLKAKAEKADKVEKLTQDASEKARFDAAVEQRVALVTEARKHLGADWKADGKDELTIRREVVAKLTPSAKLDGPDGKPRSADFIAGVYETAIEGAHASRETFDAFGLVGLPHMDAFGKPKPGDDDTDERGDTEKAYDSMVEDMRNAWKKKAV